jgi:type I restriction enzyme S subunit
MKMVPLGDLMVARTQTLNPSKYADEEFELHSIPSFDRGTPEIALGRVIGSTKQTVEPRDVLVSKIVPHIRRATVIPPASGRKQLASNEWIVFRHDSFDPSYLAHFLTSDLFHRQFLNTVAGVGGSLVRARPQYVRSILAPIPPLDEQRRIAAILDKADVIRQKRRQAIAHLDTLTQSIFHDMFASIQDTETVANLAAKSKRSIRTGPFGSQLLHEEFTSEGVPVLGIDNVVENKFMWKKERYIDESKFHQLEKYEVFPDDVLITIMGTTGRCAVVPIGIPRSINTKHICAITPDTEKVLPEFLKAAFLYHPATQRFLKDNTRGAIMAGLNMGIIKKTPLPLASLSDQKTFVERSQRIDTFRTRLLIGHNSDLFASLQSRAFRGEL